MFINQHITEPFYTHLHEFELQAYHILHKLFNEMVTAFGESHIQIILQKHQHLFCELFTEMFSILSFNSLTLGQL